MPTYRIDRTSEDVARELSSILRDLKDPRVQEAMLTIVKIDLSRDLSSCKVYVSSLKGGEVAKEAFKTLKNASGFVRKELSSRVHIRHTPEIKFIPDDSIEHSADIARILNTLEVKSDEN